MEGQGAARKHFGAAFETLVSQGAGGLVMPVVF
jgi:hypothetical protein